MSQKPSHATEDGVRFWLSDPDRHAHAVRLWAEIALSHNEFEPVDGGWQLELTDLPVDRIEYMFEVDGHLGLDPENPLRVPGAFGDHSWLPLTGYRCPEWVDGTPIASEYLPHALYDTPVGRIDLGVWSPADAEFGHALPLLISHDGPEMAAFGQLTHYAGVMIAQGKLPAFRVALLTPGERDLRYAANPQYAEALAEHVLPLLAEVAPCAHPPVLMGQSLGGLAAFHAAWLYPHAFAAVASQSGSFFTPELDPQESDYRYWSDITTFTDAVRQALTSSPDHKNPSGSDSLGRALPPVLLCCGMAEENYANNTLLRQGLAAAEYEVSWGEVRDAHTWTCWRDLLDPYLTDLLNRMWR